MLIVEIELNDGVPTILVSNVKIYPFLVDMLGVIVLMLAVWLTKRFRVATIVGVIPTAILFTFLGFSS